MIIHTLGPEATDSCQAARYYLKENAVCGRVQLHCRFEEIIDHLMDYPGDYFVIPAAFKSYRAHIDWADFHYAHLDQLTLISCFRYRLNTLVLIRRQNAANTIAYTHPSTTALLENYMQQANVQPLIKYTDSKYLAYQQYNETKAQYVITNQQNIRLTSQEKIERTYTPDMIWCLYKIKNENQVK